jgi:RNA polymerase sigma-70 factor (ECF subfamily)
VVSETSIGGPASRIPETLWTDVLGARASDPERARAALARLIERYWKPVYFFVRRRGRSIESAKDLTQAFFADLLERDALSRVDPQRGRFRGWLLACVRNFLADASDRARAQRRGGCVTGFSLERAESEYLRDVPDAGATPEQAFHRKWAMDLLREAIESLDEKWRTLLRVSGADPRRTYEARAALRQALLARIRATVDSPREAEDELRELLRGFS